MACAPICSSASSARWMCSRRRPNAMSRARDGAARQMLLALGTRPTAGGLQQICYSDLGVEQLGAVYERVLDVPVDPHPDVDPGERPKSGRHSARRKESGTFYTPQELAEFVVRRTLAPLVAGR